MCRGESIAICFGKGFPTRISRRLYDAAGVNISSLFVSTRCSAAKGKVDKNEGYDTIDPFLGARVSTPPQGKIFTIAETSSALAVLLSSHVPLRRSDSKQTPSASHRCDFSCHTARSENIPKARCDETFSYPRVGIRSLLYNSCYFRWAHGLTESFTVTPVRRGSCLLCI